jgi:hypothetical protein
MANKEIQDNSPYWLDELYKQGKTHLIIYAPTRFGMGISPEYKIPHEEIREQKEMDYDYMAYFCRHHHND